MTNEDIEKLRALCEAATPGPWLKRETRVEKCTAAPPWSWPYVEGPDDPDLGTAVTVAEWNETGAREHHDAAFIAAARTALPAALDALEQARRERDDALQRERARPHWAECAVSHGGTACDMGPECGLPPEERALMLSVERRIASWLDEWEPPYMARRDFGVQNEDVYLFRALRMSAKHIRSGAWKDGAK